MSKASIASKPLHTTVMHGPAEDDIASARRVLDHAASSLKTLSAALGPDIAAAVSVFAKVTGRVIVSGVGKSSLVGAKIAATLASTGTPAQPVHAAEASHGDLGMITRHDAVLALSNSGETPELGNLVSYTRRFGIPLVAITSRADSTLAQAADVALVLPDVGEACPLGLAPTTSTTLMMALGDAIAVALLERRGFTADDFKVFHPGGHLGRKLYKVDDLMHIGDELPLVKPDTAMADVVPFMTSKTFGVAGVTDGDGRLIGIVTDGDLRRHIASLFSMTAGEVMTRTPKSISRGILAAEALRHMNDWKITCLFVVEDGKPVGILRMHDILRSGAV